MLDNHLGRFLQLFLTAEMTFASSAHIESSYLGLRFGKTLAQPSLLNRCQFERAHHQPPFLPAEALLLCADLLGALEAEALRNHLPVSLLIGSLDSFQFLLPFPDGLKQLGSLLRIQLHG